MNSAAVLPVLWCGCSAAGSRCAPVSLSLHSVPLYSDIPAAFEWSTDIFRDHWVIFALQHIYEHVQQEHRKSVGRAHYINLINMSHVYPVVITLHNIMHLAEAFTQSNLHSRNIHKKHERHSVHNLFVMCMKLITCVTSPLRVSRLRESPSCKMLSFERARWRGVLPARSRASTRAPEGMFIMYELVLN